MAICPICSSQLKKGENMVFCQNFKPKKIGNDFVNDGTCDFKINLKNKFFGALSVEDVKNLLAMSKVKNKKGDSIELDLKNKEFYTKITFAEKKVEDF